MTEIAQIKTLKNIAIFRQFDWKDLSDFNKLNLIYGWNGSGKSTLSAVFQALEERRGLDPNRYPNAEFQISKKDGFIYNEKNVGQCDLKVTTFSREFISRHIDWDKQISGILLVDQKKIEDVEKLGLAKKVTEEAEEKTKAAEIN